MGVDGARTRGRSKGSAQEDDRQINMLESRPIIAFVATTTPARAKAFYSKTLGLKLVSEDAFALVFDAGWHDARAARR